ncbi:TPA: reverse transcriptase domain-containing protein [Vibrio vulnificus]|nr:hypothetical protein [Vibrio vulnificus]HDU8768340.1 hypothetical protein [Vibrio vulnificus]
MAHSVKTSKPTDFLSFLRTPSLEQAFSTLCKRRRHFPSNSDIWHLRFHWQQRKVTLAQQLVSGSYRLQPMELIQKSDGSRCAIWPSEEALVLLVLTQYLTSLLPVHEHCEHVKGHKGGKSSVQRLHHKLFSGGYSFVCRTDIRGYYAHINRTLLWQQLRKYVTDAVALDLLSQFLHYSVEWGGLFHTPQKGIPRSSSLSPLLAAFHLYSIDEDFTKQPNLYYARYMDDFIILTKSRWQLRRAVRRLNRHLTAFHFEQHPNKTFIGKIDKGFDWMGFWFTHNGCTKIAPRALSNHLIKLRRLYEQMRKLPTLRQAIRMTSYISRWHRWKDHVLLALDVTSVSQSSINPSASNLHFCFYRSLNQSHQQ